jgi:hypothetical protein
LQDQRHRVVTLGIDPDVVCPERIGDHAFAKIMHGERRDLRQVIEGANVAWRHSGLAPMALIERNLPRALHLAKKTLLLQSTKLIA